MQNQPPVASAVSAVSPAMPPAGGQLLKFAVELGPLGVFFLVNAKWGIFYATGVFMAATVLSLAVSRLLFRKTPVMPLVTGVFVIILGGLTIYLHNETFIKMKPTIVNLLFASILAGGLLWGRLLLKLLFNDVLRLQDEGWRLLTLRWAGFCIFLAVANEIVWRGFSTDAWVAFKVFGIMPLTFLFMLSQIGLLQRYQLSSPIEE